MALFFVNTNTGKRYKVVHLDRDNGTITLQGETTQFVEPYDKERFKKLGYQLVNESDDEE